MVTGCSGVWSSHLACNFSPNPGHRLCGFLPQSTNIRRLPGGSLHSLGLGEFSSCSVFGAGKGCLSLPGMRPLLEFCCCISSLRPTVTDPVALLLHLLREGLAPVPGCLPSLPAASAHPLQALPAAPTSFC